MGGGVIRYSAIHNGFQAIRRSTIWVEKNRYEGRHQSGRKMIEQVGIC